MRETPPPASSRFHGYAERALGGELLDRAESLDVLGSGDAELLDLLAAAHRVRRARWGNRVQLHMLMNAKSGACQEDCGYCSQSRVSSAAIDVFPLVDEAAMIEGARRAQAAKAGRFCLVIATRGPSWPDVRRLSSAVARIRAEVGIPVCVSAGLLDEPKARALAEAGVSRLNHNLNTSQRFYPEITSTHSYEDRMATLAAARDAGIALCSGALFGMGETHDDVIDVIKELRALDVESLPVNFLHPIEGTPLAGLDELRPADCLRILCLVRFLHPRAEIRVAGGRELHLGALQPLSLYPANSIFVEGYLTTPGQPAAEAWRMIEDLGFEIEEHLDDAGPALDGRAAGDPARAGAVAD